ncbi:sulfatase family protein [Zobellia russellii]|uniref:sulfatase family protein n=2 Tax=Zobellia TaxID=112040 RepID=UPI001BFFA16A|nr:sulfatase-like hydrolase/transferase [Zobellia russellii]MBT9188264.1 sulfatase-like hydrolase/transferase [Zobellia russellii]
MKNITLLTSIILAITCLTSCKEVKQVSKEKTGEKLPNIVFILSDDQAWTDYGFMGHKFIETPNLDKFASESRTFTRGYVPTSLCSPSLASIITGVYPRDHMVLGNDRVLPGNVVENNRAWEMPWRSKNYNHVIENFKQLETLPKMLKDKGYVSFQTGKWWIGNYANGGFDYGMTHGDPERGGRHGDYGLEIGRKGMDTLYSYIDLALEKKKPFFAWYAPFLPHSPHNPPDSLLQKYRKKAPSEYVAKYWAMCEWFDNTCGDLMDYIDQKGEMENTLFVYVCDNGWVQNENNSNYNPISKQAPYDYGLRTPIMFKWKGKITPYHDDRSLVSSLDMVPTVLSLLGIERPKALDGINVLDKNELENRKAIFGEIYNHDFNTVEESLKYKMVMTDPYKLIVPNSKNRPNEKVQLFNIYEDPLEQTDIADENPSIVEELKKKIEESWKN